MRSGSAARVIWQMTRGELGTRPPTQYHLSSGCPSLFGKNALVGIKPKRDDPSAISQDIFLLCCQEKGLSKKIPPKCRGGVVKCPLQFENDLYCLLLDIKTNVAWRLLYQMKSFLQNEPSSYFGRSLNFLVFFTFMGNSGSLFEFERKRGTKNYSLDFWKMEMRQKNIILPILE